MYTCFKGKDTCTPRLNRIGLTIFCRTLAGCIAEGAMAGDTIIGWTSGGGVRATYTVTDNLTARKVKS